MQKIMEVKRDGEKTPYHFLWQEGILCGDRVVVDFEEFQTVCEVLKTEIDVSDGKATDVPRITRKASEKDLAKFNELKAKAKSQIPQIKKKSLELGLMMKFVSAEYSLDGSKVLIVFSSEERVDFRQLLKELATMLKTRIELKQIGQRDEVKICGGVGPCGEPCCCARFLNNFEHVTVKMAKTQGLSLSPTKINGICGRLMCCLAYESETYEKILEKMPKIGSEVNTPSGKGQVVYNDILRERVSVKREIEAESFVVEDFALDEIGMNGKPAKPRKVEESKPLSSEHEQGSDIFSKPNASAKTSNTLNKPNIAPVKEKRERDDKKFEGKKQASVGMEIVEDESVSLGVKTEAEEKSNHNGKWSHFSKSKKFKKSYNGNVKK